jgi:hypothetical protein
MTDQYAAHLARDWDRLHRPEIPRGGTRFGRIKG